jgi:hypothetical protein
MLPEAGSQERNQPQAIGGKHLYRLDSLGRIVAFHRLLVDLKQTISMNTAALLPADLLKVQHGPSVLRAAIL